MDLAQRDPGLDLVPGLVRGPSPARDPNLDLTPSLGIRILRSEDRDRGLALSPVRRMTKSEDQGLDPALSPDPAQRMENEADQDPDLGPSLDLDPGPEMEENLPRRSPRKGRGPGRVLLRRKDRDQDRGAPSRKPRRPEADPGATRGQTEIGRNRHLDPGLSHLLQKIRKWRNRQRSKKMVWRMRLKKIGSEDSTFKSEDIKKDIASQALIHQSEPSFYYTIFKLIKFILF